MPQAVCRRHRLHHEKESYHSHSHYRHHHIYPAALSGIWLRFLILLLLNDMRAIKKKFVITIVWILILAAALGLAYSLYITYQSGAVEAGVITCPSENDCFWTAHVHGYIPIQICGADFRLPIEVGRLDDSHTHEEKNIVHWHDKLPYDPEAKAITNTRPLTLGAFFDSVNVPFDSERIADKQNGDLCPGGTAGAVSLFINGEKNEQYRNYIWRDKDVMMIFFDNVPAEAREIQLKENPVRFPKLGRG
jgi:hypothetical protein